MLAAVRLALALCATVHVARAAIEASNSSMGPDPFNYAGQLWLQDADGANITELVPLSLQATTTNLDGSLFLTTDQTVANISDKDIAFISCDPYPGHLQAQDIFQSAYNSSEINGAIFYSTTSLYCVYKGITDMMQSFPIYSMNSTADSASTLQRLRDPSAPRINVSVVRSVTSSGSNNGPPNSTFNNPSQNPLGPSPSTAVAMIILYSITGIITALFLVIIVTGAIRAHRHPDRYGPRDVLGRPRQSRARGLGRAILDTIPIVKFGQTDPPKPTDVELGSTSEVRDANATNAEPNAQTAQTTAQPDGAPTAEAPLDTPAAQHETMASGISEAQPAAAGAAATQSENADESLVCSICTEEFEKGQDIRVLPCNHKFHPDCVDPWLLNVSGTCPLCRVDLRPVTTNDSTDSSPNTDPEHLAPPLQSSNDLSHRRRTLMRDILSFRTRPDASADERISALRRLRDQRRNRSEEGVDASDENVASQRRSRLSVRLSGVFHARRRREDGSTDREEQASTPVPATASASADALAPIASAGPAPAAAEREQR